MNPLKMNPLFYSTKPPEMVPISVFNGARDRKPRPKTPTLTALTTALTRFKIREDISRAATKELSVLDDWLARLVMTGGRPPSDLTRGAPTWARLWQESSLMGTLDDRVERFRGLQAKRIWSRYKLTIPAWSPAKFKNGSTRSLSAVELVSCLVLDIDDGKTGLKEILEVWGDVFFIVHTSWSHQDEAPRLRVAFPLSEPVPAKDWPNAWEWARSQFPSLDEACKDASRIYFVPAIKTPSSPHFHHVNPGKGFLKLVGDHIPRAPRPRPLPKIKPRPPITVPRNDADRVARFRMDRDPGTRRRVAHSVGAKLRGSGDNERATRGGPCPSCGRMSIWWYIHPTRKATASCDHIGAGKCNWFGRLWEVK